MSPLAEWGACAALRQSDIDAAVALGVPVLALAEGYGGAGVALARDRVVLHPNGRRFEFSRYSRGAFLDVPATIALAFDRQGEPVDLVAFRFTAPAFAASWLGRVGMLGEEVLDVSFLNDPVRVWPDALSWLQHSREGVVVVDPVRAGRLLRSVGPLSVGSWVERKALADLLAVKLPTISIEAPARREATA